MRKLPLIFIFTGFLLMSSPAFADTVVDVGVTTGSWQTWVEPNNHRPPYWDGMTYDPVPPGPINIGYYLRDNQGAGPGWQFWAKNPAGKADPDFRFYKTDPAQNATLKLEVAGFSSTNELWWYNSTSGY